MGDKMIPMDEKYRAKHFPKGFFAAMAKDARGGGVALIICGAVLALMGAGILWMLISMMLDGGFDVSEETGVMIFFGILGLIFFIPGILIVRFGVKRSRMGEEGWIQESMEASGYQESTIRDFANQAMEDGSLRLQLGTSGMKGFLTRDYIFFHNIVIKIEDIVGAYFVEMSYTVNVNGKTKRMFNKNIRIISNHKTATGSEAKEDTIKKLLDMLTQKNPAIDTQGGRLLSEKEYDQMAEQLGK